MIKPIVNGRQSKRLEKEFTSIPIWRYCSK